MKKSSINKIVIMAIILVLAVLFVRGFREPAVSMDGNKLIIRSASGVTLNKSEINSMRLITVIPTLTREGGFGVGTTQKGPVSSRDLGKGLAYVNWNNPPYIYLELNSDKGYVFLNLYNADDTQVLYGSIREWLQR